MIKNKREEIEWKRANGLTSWGRTVPEEAKEYKRCYWYIEDGECSLDNPIVRQRLTGYIYRYIKSAIWIFRKNFTDAEEIFSIVEEQIKDLKPFQYGDENTPPILFLIIKIRKAIGRHWRAYFKTSSPDAYRDFQKRCALLAAVRYKERRLTDSGNAALRKVRNKQQKKYIAELSDHYIIPLVYNDLKRTTGMTFSFAEIRASYTYLIQHKRESIQRKREKLASKASVGSDTIQEEVINKKKSKKPIVVATVVVDDLQTMYIVDIGTRLKKFTEYDAALEESEKQAKKRGAEVLIYKSVLKSEIAS